MIRTATTRASLAVLCAAIVLPSLAACDSGSSSNGLSLAATKSSAQLLRNNALDRISDEYVSHVVERKDISKSCVDAASDPKELMRSWYSTALVDIVPIHMADTAEIMQVLADDLAPQGWTAAGTEDRVVLTKGESTSKITLSVVPRTSQLLIESEGPCVETDGPNSSEVTSLESLAER